MLGKTGHRGSDVAGYPLASPDSDRSAFDRLFSLAYDDLKRIARRQLAHESRSHPLATADLVHESYLKLVGQTHAQWTDRGQLLAIASNAMHRILVDHARRTHAAKRSAEWAGLDEATLPGDAREPKLAALDEALARLRTVDERLGRGVECRFFQGYTEEETAEALGVTTRTVRRDWVKARQWLHRALRE